MGDESEDDVTTRYNQWIIHWPARARLDLGVAL